MHSVFIWVKYLPINIHAKTQTLIQQGENSNKSHNDT